MIAFKAQAIRAMNPDGTSVHALASGSNADGSPLLFDAPAWSPDGSKIAFNRDDEIVVTDMHGRNPQALTDTATYEWRPAWSPDGSRLAFTRNLQVWVMNADGTDERQVTTVCCNTTPTWSADGQHLAFESDRSGAWQIHSLDLAAGEPAVQLTHGAINRWPDWSPDGTEIAFVSGRRINNADLWLMNADGSNERALTANPEGERDPSWSQDGQQLVYERGGFIAVVGRNGSGDHQLGPHGADPDWQPLPACTVSGTGASDSLMGTDQSDVLCGQQGDDTIISGPGNDIIIGGAGSDTLCFEPETPGVDVDLQVVHSSGDGDDTVLLTENACGTDGDDVLRGNEVANRLPAGAGADVVTGRGGADTMAGGPDRDAVAFSGGHGATVDLAAGTAEEEGATDTLSEFEDVIGSPGIDDITGDAAANRLHGGEFGPDHFDGGDGDDTIIGSVNGGGSVDYAESSAAVDVDLASGIATGAGRDTLVRIAGVAGSPFDDHLRGPIDPTYGNGIFGLAGDDIITSRLDGGWIAGHEGTDTLRLTDMTAGVTVNLAQESVTPQGQPSFPAQTFEHVIGTRYSDILIGNPADNLLRGAAGADQITPAAGNDVVFGGVGKDRLSFLNTANGVTIDLTQGLATGAGTDTVAGIEDLVGSPYADRITGDTAANQLSGDAGRDHISGRAGPDIVIGGLGTDELLGGSDNDHIRAQDSITDHVDGGTQIDQCTVDTRDTVQRCP